MTVKPAPFREYAGVLCAFVVVTAFIATGFLQMASEAVFGIKVTAPPDWSAAMLSLASAALGFLIGKQSTGPTANGDSLPPVMESVRTEIRETRAGDVLEPQKVDDVR